ncbi:MAG: helix-turn-helix transcriptional regulator, partial [Pseudomonadota bacterium]|nr:helix-turn-helix transcriptional regulator [Pseudomonadota bacterium]
MSAGPHTLTGTRIRERRMALSRRQADLARAVGISPAYLNLIEHNRRPVSAELVERLAAELEVPADELAEGREEVRIAALREAAVHPAAAGSVPELDQVAEFLARFPGWAALLIAHARRAGALERQLVDLSDRMTQDPYMLTTMHEVLSAVTAVRSTAAILVEEDEIAPEWRQRFHANLHQDSQRLSLTAQSLVAYLDSFEAEGNAATPQEEVEAWLAQGGDA